MHILNLPSSEPIGYASDPSALESLIDLALGNSKGPFGHFDRAIGGPRSVRLLFQENIRVPYIETAPLPRPYSSEETAREFFNDVFANQARFDPREPPTHASKKGWEVRRAVYNGKPFVIVLSAWVEERQTSDS